jgi:hypothetical protein
VAAGAFEGWATARCRERSPGKTAPPRSCRREGRSETDRLWSWSRAKAPRWSSRTGLAGAGRDSHGRGEAEGRAGRGGGRGGVGRAENETSGAARATASGSRVAARGQTGYGGCRGPASRGPQESCSRSFVRILRFGRARGQTRARARALSVRGARRGAWRARAGTGRPGARRRRARGRGRCRRARCSTRQLRVSFRASLRVSLRASSKSDKAAQPLGCLRKRVLPLPARGDWFLRSGGPAARRRVRCQ